MSRLNKWAADLARAGIDPYAVHFSASLEESATVAISIEGMTQVWHLAPGDGFNAAFTTVMHQQDIEPYANHSPLSFPELRLGTIVFDQDSTTPRSNKNTRSIYLDRQIPARHRKAGEAQ